MKDTTASNNAPNVRDWSDRLNARLRVLWWLLSARNKRLFWEWRGNVSNGGVCLSHRRGVLLGQLPSNLEGTCCCGLNPSQTNMKKTHSSSCQQGSYLQTWMSLPGKRKALVVLRSPNTAASFWNFDYSTTPTVYSSGSLLLCVTGVHVPPYSPDEWLQVLPSSGYGPGGPSGWFLYGVFLSHLRVLSTYSQLIVSHSLPLSLSVCTQQ